MTLWRVGQAAVSFNDGPRFAPRGYLTDYFTDEAETAIAKNKNRPFLLYLAQVFAPIMDAAGQSHGGAQPESSQ